MNVTIRNIQSRHCHIRINDVYNAGSNRTLHIVLAQNTWDSLLSPAISIMREGYNQICRLIVDCKTMPIHSLRDILEKSAVVEAEKYESELKILQDTSIEIKTIMAIMDGIIVSNDTDSRTALTLREVAYKLGQHILEIEERIEALLKVAKINGEE